MKFPNSISEFPISRVASLTVLRGGSLYRFRGLNRASVVEDRRRFDETFIGLRCLGVESECNANWRDSVFVDSGDICPFF